MIGYERSCRVRAAAAAGQNASQIARSLQLHRQTVVAWPKRERYERRRHARLGSQLDPYRGAIARWLDGHAAHTWRVGRI